MSILHATSRRRNARIADNENEIAWSTAALGANGMRNFLDVVNDFPPDVLAKARSTKPSVLLSLSKSDNAKPHDRCDFRPRPSAGRGQADRRYRLRPGHALGRGGRAGRAGPDRPDGRRSSARELVASAKVATSWVLFLDAAAIEKLREVDTVTADKRPAFGS